MTESQKYVSGEVRLKLYKGNVMAAGRKSPLSMYDESIATMEKDPTQSYNQNDATGFIALNALRLKASARRELKLKGKADGKKSGKKDKGGKKAGKKDGKKK